jgi:hypothetical protein
MAAHTWNQLIQGIFYRVLLDYWDNKERIFLCAVRIVRSAFPHSRPSEPP